jgi:hypothetical protein
MAFGDMDELQPVVEAVYEESRVRFPKPLARISNFIIFATSEWYRFFAY